MKKMLYLAVAAMIAMVSCSESVSSDENSSTDPFSYVKLSGKYTQTVDVENQLSSDILIKHYALRNGESKVTETTVTVKSGEKITMFGPEKTRVSIINAYFFGVDREKARLEIYTTGGELLKSFDGRDAVDGVVTPFIIGGMGNRCWSQYVSISKEGMKMEQGTTYSLTINQHLLD